MPSISHATDNDYKINMNMNMNITGIMREPPLDINECLSFYKNLWIIDILNSYTDFSCECSTMLHAILTSISAIRGKSTFINPTNNNESSFNIYTHILGELRNVLMNL